MEYLSMRKDYQRLPVVFFTCLLNEQTLIKKIIFIITYEEVSNNK